MVVPYGTEKELLQVISCKLNDWCNSLISSKVKFKVLSTSYHSGKNIQMVSFFPNSISAEKLVKLSWIE